MKKEYKCICGKIFDNPQKFNGHKQGCNEHIINKYGSLEAYYLIKNRNHDHGKKVSLHYQDKKQQELEKWISERHICQKCGKVMTEKFGSGKFCSRSCANSRVQTEDSNRKRSSTIRNKTSIEYTNIPKHTVKCPIDKPTKGERNRFNYIDNPSYCKICQRELPYEHRQNQTCCKECTNRLHSVTMHNNYKNGSIHQCSIKRYKYGTYNGVHCDSSWELAFVLYLIDNHISFTRNVKEYFSYVYNGEEHLFYPDFIIDNEFYEIKNYKSALTDAKIKYFPKDKILHILYFEDIKKYLQYAKENYGEKFIEMYDRNYPSWMDNS